MDETTELLEVAPGASAYYAVVEMNFGRLYWLAEHIRACDFQISPLVARKILAMLEGSERECFYELRAVRRSDLPPAIVDPALRRHRDFNMAIAVAQRGGFKRGRLAEACHQVGETLTPKRGWEYVAKRVRPFRQHAVDVLAEEEAAAAYQRGETDYLGRPKRP